MNQPAKMYITGGYCVSCWTWGERRRLCIGRGPGVPRLHFDFSLNHNRTYLTWRYP
jgi:hypothetical protein